MGHTIVDLEMAEDALHEKIGELGQKRKARSDALEAAKLANEALQLADREEAAAYAAAQAAGQQVKALIEELTTRPTEL